MRQRISKRLIETLKPRKYPYEIRDTSVSRQNLLNLELPELRDTLAHQVGM